MAIPPIKIFNDFSNLQKGDFNRFVSTWAKRIHDAANQSISTLNTAVTDISTNATSITNLGTDIDDLQNQISSSRIIRGRISAAGVILAGSGFTVNRPANGQYDITLNTAYVGLFSMVVTPNVASGSPHYAGVSVFSNSVVTVYMYSSAAILDNNDFHFIIAGPAF